MEKIALQQLALKAAFALNEDLLISDAAWGYSGSKEDFDRIYHECLVIARDEIGSKKSIDEVLDAFWDIQMEIMNGNREVDWYL